MMLRLDWAGPDAAQHACTKWHYSRSVPAAPIILGAWEDERFIGVVTFGNGSTPHIGKPYELGQHEVCELTRIALREHATPVSRIIAIALKMLRRQSPGLRLVISYAAAEHGHHGGIYQASGWIYEGPMDSHGFVVKGKFTHARSIGSKYGTGTQSLEWLRANLDPSAEYVNGLIRHKYLKPLDPVMEGRVRPLAKPYPKRD